MVADDIVILFGQHTNQHTALSSAAQQAIKACRETISAGLKSFAFSMLLRMYSTDLADKAESNQKQEEYFTAMRQILLIQCDIKKKFTQKIGTDFEPIEKEGLVNTLVQQLSFANPTVH